MSQKSRVAKGQPTGGQFATEAKSSDELTELSGRPSHKLRITTTDEKAPWTGEQIHVGTCDCGCGWSVRAMSPATVSSEFRAFQRADQPESKWCPDHRKMADVLSTSTESHNEPTGSGGSREVYSLVSILSCGCQVAVPKHVTTARTI